MAFRSPEKLGAVTGGEDRKKASAENNDVALEGTRKSGSVKLSLWLRYTNRAVVALHDSC